MVFDLKNGGIVVENCSIGAINRLFPKKGRDTIVFGRFLNINFNHFHDFTHFHYFVLVGLHKIRMTSVVGCPVNNMRSSCPSL